MIYDDKLNKRKKEKLEGETDRLKAQRNRKIDREDEGGEERTEKMRKREKEKRRRERELGRKRNRNREQ